MNISIMNAAGRQHVHVQQLYHDADRVVDHSGVRGEQQHQTDTEQHVYGEHEMELRRDGRELRLDHVHKYAVIHRICIRHIGGGNQELVRHEDNVDDTIYRGIPICPVERRDLVKQDRDGVGIGV